MPPSGTVLITYSTVLAHAVLKIVAKPGRLPTCRSRLKRKKSEDHN